jgi:hypothetical protein
MPPVLTASSTPGGLSLTRRLGMAVTAAEPLLVLALLPFIWFPRWWSGWLLLLIPLLWGVRGLVQGRWWVRTPYDLPTACMLVLLPLTLLPVFDWQLAGPKLLAFLLGLGVTFGLARALTSRSLVLVGVYATALVFGGGVALAGFVGTEWVPGKVPALDPFYRHLPTLIQGITRYGSRGAIHPNEIGGALTLLTPLAGALTLVAGQQTLGRGASRRGRRWRTAIVLLAALGGLDLLIGLVLLLTLSRSALMGLAVGLTLVVAWWLVGIPRSPGRRRLGAAVLVVLAGVATLASWRLVSTWTATASTGVDSFPTRLEIWQRATLMLEDFPLTGIGMGQFEPVLHSLYIPLLVEPGEYVPHAHNFFLQLGLDLGILGGLAFVVLLAGFFRAVWGAYRQTDDVELRAVAVGLAAGLVSFLVYGLTDAIVVGSRGAIVMWLFLGLGAALGRLEGCTVRRDRGCPG